MQNKDKTRKSAGRPSKKENINNELLNFLYSQGLTDVQVAKLIGVNECTIHRWKNQFPELRKPLKDWKDEADSKVERSLYERACGYSHQEEKIFTYLGEVIRVNTIKHYAPDPVSMIFWLKNRQPDKWRETKEVTIPDADKYFKEIADAISKADTDSDSVLQ